MARPQSPDYDKRRDSILAAAAHLYARRGFQGTSVSDLASACNTSKSLIYHYFPSKDDTLHAVMEAHLDALVDAADEAMRAGSAEDRLRALTLAFMQLYVGAQDSHKVLLNELDNLPPAQRTEVVSKQRRIIAVVESLILEIRPDLNPVTLPLTMLFFGMINWTHTWFRPAGRMGADEIGELAVDLILRGLEAVTVD